MDWTVRDAVEADADALSALAGVPTDVARNLVHDRTVRVAVAGDTDRSANPDPEADGDSEDVVGFVSFDAHEDCVHVTQVGGSEAVCERLLSEPLAFAKREGMAVELLVPERESSVRAAAERAGYERRGEGPPFEGDRTVRYRVDP